MQSRILILLITFAALLEVGCQPEAVEVAPAGAAPAIATPVGPVPGVEQQPPERQNPYGQDRVAIEEGRKLFVRYNCYGCHGGHAGGGMGPSLRDAVWMYGGSDAHVFESIAQGRAHGMPSWGTKLPQEQIWKLVAYVKSLRTPLEPQPPE